MSSELEVLGRRCLERFLDPSDRRKALGLLSPGIEELARKWKCVLRRSKGKNGLKKLLAVLRLMEKMV